MRRSSALLSLLAVAALALPLRRRREGVDPPRSGHERRDRFRGGRARIPERVGRTYRAMTRYRFEGDIEDRDER